MYSILLNSALIYYKGPDNNVQKSRIYSPGIILKKQKYQKLIEKVNQNQMNKISSKWTDIYRKKFNRLPKRA